MRTRAKAQDACCLDQGGRAGQNIDHQFPGTSQTNLTLDKKNFLADAAPQIQLHEVLLPRWRRRMSVGSSLNPNVTGVD